MRTQRVGVEKEVPADRLKGLAEHIIAERERRGWFFPRTVFGETAREILLLLYVSDTKLHSLHSLAKATLTPQCITERWVRYLENEELVAAPAAANDEDVMLAPRGIKTLELYLSDRLERMQTAERLPPKMLAPRAIVPLVVAVALMTALASGIAYALAT